MLTFQQIILKLQSYWADQGCALLQPYDMEVGAGTSHTATFLRAIGPETWNAAYVQPSRRPARIHRRFRRQVVRVQVRRDALQQREHIYMSGNPNGDDQATAGHVFGRLHHTGRGRAGHATASP